MSYSQRSLYSNPVPSTYFLLLPRIIIFSHVTLPLKKNYTHTQMINDSTLFHTSLGLAFLFSLTVYWISFHRTKYSPIQCSIMKSYIPLFIQPVTLDWHLVCFRSFAIKSIAAICMCLLYFSLCIFEVNFSSIRIILLSVCNSVWESLFLNHRRPQWYP